MDLRERLKIWFFSDTEQDLLMGETANIKYRIPGRDLEFTRGEGEEFEMADPDHTILREEVVNNREMINSLRVRMGRIDERTAFIARLIFGLFVAFVVAVGSGLVLAFII